MKRDTLPRTPRRVFMLSHIDNPVGAKEDRVGEMIDTALKSTLVDMVPSWLLPDHVSVARGACLTPLIACGYHPIPAVSILLFSSACDILDGSLARARKQTTDDGAAGDAMVDKIFLLGALLSVCYDRVHPGFVWSFVWVDAAIGIVRWLKRRRGVSLNSNPWGKRKTITLSVAIAFVLTNEPFLVDLAPAAFFVALFCAFMSFAGHYDQLRKPSRNPHQSRASM